MAPLLSARGLRVVRGGKALLGDVEITCTPGEVLGVLGPSGAGKSTLFRALMGDIELDAGVVTLAGMDVTTWPLWRRARAGMGYVPQTPSVLWDLTVRENLIVFQQIAGQAPGAAAALATQVHLDDRLGVRASQLSAGERRRLELARALVPHPRLLICDEPFAGVDPAASQHLAELLGALASDGAAVLLADHHVSQALGVCSRAMLLLEGAVAAVTDPKTFLENPVVRAQYLGTTAELPKSDP